MAIPELVNHKWEGKETFIRTQWEMDAYNWMPAKIAKKDQPMLLADYIVQHPMERTCSRHWNLWAKKAKKSINQTMQFLHCVHRLSSFNNANDCVSGPVCSWQ